uniref:uncharacterized protein LOC100179284 isoform X2 n=1 Tax=Ciona intestinalis TaxID=7719 RepID=UPI000EF4899D|nr:uncharacterized protein LOC100179284 isoform X2 [Ciona intestinalis]|eukprot:XP_026695598.1 uncharacterized protein LOC100179284 isoform X2 [Ciona intestinalis]
MESVFQCIILLMLVRFSASLFCYQCYRTDSNVICNENEPMKCGPQQPMCAVDTGVPRTVQKGCIEQCPLAGRGDMNEKTCWSCSDDFCNFGPGLPTPPGLKSEPVVVRFKALKFSIFHQPATFWEARYECAKIGETLVSILNPETNSFLETKLQNDPKPDTHGGYWIGAQWIKENKNWIWTDTGRKISNENYEAQCSSYQRWASGEPTRPINRNYCARIGLDGWWITESCAYVATGFICQKSNSGLMQTTAYQSQLYTFHSIKVPQTEARKICSGTGSKLAKFNNEAVMYKIIRLLSYCINSQQFWMEQECEHNPPVDHRTNVAIYSCKTLQPFLCQRGIDEQDVCPVNDEVQNSTQSSNFKTTKKQFITTSETYSTNSILTVTQTVQGKTPNEPIPPLNITMQIPSCKKWQRIYHGKFYNFPEVKQGTFSLSNEKCSSKRSLASVFCPKTNNENPSFDDNSFAMSPCYKTLDCIYENVKSFNRAVPTPVELKTLTGDLRVLTSQPTFMTQDNITYATDILKVINMMSHNKRSTSLITALILGDLLTTADQLHDKVSDSTNNNNKLELVEMVENFAAKIEFDKNQNTYELEGNNIAVKTMDYYMKNYSKFTEQSKFVFKQSSYGDVLSQLEIDPTNFDQVQNSSKIRIVFVGFLNSSLFPSSNGSTKQVISASVFDENENKVNSAVNFAFQGSEKQDKCNDCLVESCSFYDPHNQIWKEDGCHRTHISENDTVHCTCNHTTSFAVVVRMKQGRAHYVLDVVSKIGLFICIVCFTMTVILFFILPELQRIRSSGAHVSLCICLILAYIAFLAGVERTNNRILCVTVAASIHYFLIAAWGWMAVESITMYRMFVNMFERQSMLSCRKMVLIVHSLSALVVAGTITASYFNQRRKIFYIENSSTQDVWSGYIGDQYCWLVGPCLYFGFLLIVGVILLANMIVAFLVIKAITWGRSKVQSSTEEPPAIHILRAVLVSVLLGMTWLFAIPVSLSNDDTVQLVFGWFFAISTSSQGVFVFYFFCVRRDDVRQAWTKPICRLICQRWIAPIEPGEFNQQTKSTSMTFTKSGRVPSVSRTQTA